jgi:hypothetical protein
VEIVSCPTCAAPAEIEERGALVGTDGPVQHVKVTCVRRHWFLMPRDMLEPVAAVNDVSAAAQS